MRRLTILIVLAVVAHPLEAQVASFEPVESAHLSPPFAGAAVVRDSARWVTLWQRFGRPDANGAVAPSMIPTIDFLTEMVVVVSPGPRSGCSNRVSIIREVIQTVDSVVVGVGRRPSDDGGLQITCMMVVYPVEIARLPRTSRPVVFRGPQDWIAPAEWWNEPTPEELDRMPEQKRRTFWQALARDPATPSTTIAHIAGRLTNQDWGLSQRLLSRPEVRESPAILTDLALLERDAGQEAQRFLFDRFGLELAESDSTPLSSLRALLNELTRRRDSPPFGISRALLRHPRILEDRDLLIQLARDIRPFPELRAEACREILTRYSVWEPTLDRSGRPTGGWGSRVPCPNLPPPPPH